MELYKVSILDKTELHSNNLDQQLKDMTACEDLRF